MGDLPVSAEGNILIKKFKITGLFRTTAENKCYIEVLSEKRVNTKIPKVSYR